MRMQIDVFEPQHTARAAGNAFAAGQAVTVLDRDTPPGMSADVYSRRAVICADAALHTTAAVWYDAASHQHLLAAAFLCQ